MSTIRAIVATEAKHAAEGEADLIKRVKKCMAASVGHWMATDEEDQFAGAVAAAMTLSEGDELEALDLSMKALNSISALLSGAPVDLDAITAAIEDTKKRGLPEIQLMKLWKEAKGEAA